MDVKEYERIVQAATDIHSEHTTEVEIDTAPAVSIGDDGAWVSAWVFVPNASIEEEEDDIHLRGRGRRHGETAS